VLPPQLKRGRCRELDEAEVKALLRELEKMAAPARIAE
jgi:23S rRNA pseudouridine2605 synthase